MTRKRTPMMASDETRINRSDIRAQLTDLLASADKVLPTSAMTSVYRHLCQRLYIQTAVAHALHRVRLELRRQAWRSRFLRRIYGSHWGLVSAALAAGD